MEEIYSEMVSINGLLIEEKRKFYIPDFQREFVWGREEAEELINDFAADTENFSTALDKLQGYLLGNIVLIEEDHKQYLVVDGQQRITTLTLLFKALHEKTKKLLDEDMGKERDKLLKKMGQLNLAYEILDEEDNFNGLRLSHSVNLSFGNHYKKIIRTSESDVEDITSESNVLSTISDSNIDEVYLTLLEKIEELDKKQIFNFIAYLKSKVKLILTKSSSEGKAFQLFEVLNDRGRSLEPMDLIKNNFLKKLNFEGFKKEEIDSFNESWKNFVNNLYISKKNKIASSTFMKHFVVCNYYVNLKQDKLFDYFKENEIFTGTEILSLAEKLEKSAKMYTDIQTNPFNNTFLSNNKSLYAIFNILRIKQLHPILMAFYEADKDNKEKISDLLSRYGASIVFSFQQTNAIEKELPLIMKEVSKGKTFDERYSNAEKAVMRLITSNIEVLKNTMATKNLVNSNGNALGKATDILKYIELCVMSNNLVTRPNKKLTLEHILATNTAITNFSDYGFSDEKDFIESLNKIGNLTLLYNDENSAASNKDIEFKKSIYESSDCKITKLISVELSTPIKNGKETMKINKLNKYRSPEKIGEKWTKKNIESRSEKIATLLKDFLMQT